MLGWEFPPHISGGLGTACRGLSRGAAEAGAELTFVVPCAHGDEDVDWMRFVPLERRSVGDEANALAPYRRFDHGPMPIQARQALTRIAGWRLGRLPRTAKSWLDFCERVAEALRFGRPSDLEQARGLREVAPFRGGYGPELLVEVARYAERVGAIAREIDVDLVHAHDWMTVPAGLVAARVAGVPLVVHVHSTEFDRAAHGPDGRVLEIERLGLEASDGVVAVSRFAADGLVRHFGCDPKKLRVVHNSVEGVRATSAAPRSELGRPPTVLFLGRVTHQKGPEELLAAARLVVDQRPEVRFVIAGDGDLLPTLVQRGAEIGLAENVLYTGFLDGPAVARALELADLFVLPSVSEPFGIAPLEAALAGVPVVLSDRCGVSEVLPSAPTYRSGDPRDLADRILDGLFREDLRSAQVDGARADLERSSWVASGAELDRVWTSWVG